jgi:hypothetical protein
MRIAPTITLTEEQALQLQAWARGRSVEVRLAQRAQMILLAAQGMTDHAIAAQLKKGRRIGASGFLSKALLEWSATHHAREERGRSLWQKCAL